jgi:hypothetical protein
MYLYLKSVTFGTLASPEMLAAINMRFKTIFLLIAVLLCQICFAQQNYKDQILILSPNKVFNYISPEEIGKENDDMWYEIKCNGETSKHLNTLDSIRNVHVMDELESESFKNFDILKLPSFISYHYL